MSIAQTVTWQNLPQELFCSDHDLPGLMAVQEIVGMWVHDEDKLPPIASLCHMQLSRNQEGSAASWHQSLQKAWHQCL